MTPADIDRVFGRGRLRMVTGDHVEVYREQAHPGERRRYTKRFLTTSAGDFRRWTEREWRILARLVGHGIKSVPDVVQFDRGSADRPALVQTYDAGITVDHWATLLPLERDGTVLTSVFKDSAHWWALARHSLIALDAIHDLSLVHLDLKADNICIPAGPTDFDPLVGDRSLYPRFEDLTLIDFAFSLVSGERLQSALPIAAQRDYAYQSPRLLRALEAGRDGDLAPTRQLDWRCDFFSLAAMLRRYLPELDDASSTAMDAIRPCQGVRLRPKLDRGARCRAADDAASCGADRSGFRIDGPAQPQTLVGAGLAPGDRSELCRQRCAHAGDARRVAAPDPGRSSGFVRGSDPCCDAAAFSRDAIPGGASPNPSATCGCGEEPHRAQAVAPTPARPARRTKALVDGWPGGDGRDQRPVARSRLEGTA